MSGFIATIVYRVRGTRQPIDPRLKWRHVGDFSIVAFAFVLLTIWVKQSFGPLNGLFWGELLGVTAIYLLS